MKEGFRLAGEISQFYEEIDFLRKKSQKLLVWQNNEEGERITCDAIIKSFIVNKTGASIGLQIGSQPNVLKDQPSPAVIGGPGAAVDRPRGSPVG